MFIALSNTKQRKRKRKKKTKKEKRKKRREQNRKKETKKKENAGEKSKQQQAKQSKHKLVSSLRDNFIIKLAIHLLRLDGQKQKKWNYTMFLLF